MQLVFLYVAAISLLQSAGAQSCGGTYTVSADWLRWTPTITSTIPCTFIIPTSVTLTNCRVQVNVNAYFTLSILGTLVNSTVVQMQSQRTSIFVAPSASLKNSVLKFDVEDLDVVELRGLWSNTSAIMIQKASGVNGASVISINGASFLNSVILEVGSTGGLRVDYLSMTHLKTSSASENCYAVSIAGDMIGSTLESNLVSSLRLSADVELSASTLSVAGTSACSNDYPLVLSHVTLATSSIVYRPFNLGSISITATMTGSALTVEQLETQSGSGGSITLINTILRDSILTIRPSSLGAVSVTATMAASALTIAQFLSDASGSITNLQVDGDPARPKSNITIVLHRPQASAVNSIRSLSFVNAILSVSGGVCASVSVAGTWRNSTVNVTGAGALTVATSFLMVGSQLHAVGVTAGSDATCTSPSQTFSLSVVTLTESTLRYTPFRLGSVTLGSSPVSMSSSTIVATQLSTAAPTTTCSIFNIAGTPNTRNAVFVAPATLSIRSMRHVFLNASNAASCFSTTVTNNGVVASSTLLVACTAVSATVASVRITSAELTSSEIMFSTQRWSIVGQSFTPNNLTILNQSFILSIYSIDVTAATCIMSSLGSFVTFTSLTHVAIVATAPPCSAVFFAGPVQTSTLKIRGAASAFISSRIDASLLLLSQLSEYDYTSPACSPSGLTISTSATIMQSSITVLGPNRSTNVVSGTIQRSVLSIGSGTMPLSGVTLSIHGGLITQSNISIALHYRPTNRIVVDQLGAGTTCNVSGMCYRATILNNATAPSYVTLQSPLRVFNAISASTALSVLDPLGKDLECPSETTTRTVEDTRSKTFSETEASTRTAQSVTMSSSSTHSSSRVHTASVSPSRVRASMSSSSSHAVSETHNSATNIHTSTPTRSFFVSRTCETFSASASRRTTFIIGTVTLTRTDSATSSHTSSSSRTHSMRTDTLTIPVVPPPASSTVVEAAATTAAVATGASVVSALLGGSASADAGALAVVGMIACAPPSLRVAVGPMRFVLSPFVDFGGAAMVLGNVGVVAAFVLLQAVATHALLVCTSWREDATRFPHLSFLVCMLSLQGVVCGFLISVADVPTAAGGELALAVVAIVVVPLFVGAFLLTLYTCAMRCSSVGQYVFNDHETMSRQFLLPRGRWFPQALVRRFGFAFSSAHTTGNVRLCLAVVAHNVLFVALSRVPIGSCVAQFALLAAVKVAVLLMLVVCRPLRSHIDHLLDCANHLTLASLLLLLAVDASGVRFAVVSRDAALGSLSMLQGVFTLAKAAHMCFLNYYEVAINDDVTPPQDDVKRRWGLSLRLLALIDQAADEDRSDLYGAGSSEGCGSMELDDLFESIGFGSDDVDEALDVAAKRPLEPPPWAMLFEEPPTEVPALVAANGMFWDEGGAAKNRSDLPAFSSFLDAFSQACDCDGVAVSSASLLFTVPAALIATALEDVAVAFPKAKRRRRRRQAEVT